MLLLGSLAIAEIQVKGRQLYLTAGGYGCVVCHGPVANGAGQVGGNIRGASLEKLNTALAGQPTMQLLTTELGDDDIRELAAYLQSLETIPLIELEYNDPVWNIKQSPVTAGQWIQLVIFNNSFSDLVVNFEAFNLKVQPIQPLDTIVLKWQSKAGSYLLPDGSSLLVPAN